MLSCIHKKKGGEHNEGTNEERHSRSKRAHTRRLPTDLLGNPGAYRHSNSKTRNTDRRGMGRDRGSLYEYFTLYGLELAATFDNISLLLDEEEAE